MNFLRYYIYYILLHLTLTGSSFVQIGDAISVHVDSSASYKHISNILKDDTDEISDDLYILTPGAVLKFGKSGTPIDFNLSAKYDIYVYQDSESLDTNLMKIYLNGSYNPSEIFNSNFSYTNIEGQSAKPDFSVQADDTLALVETTTESVSLLTSYKYSPKLSFSLGLIQSELVYDSAEDRNGLSSKKSSHIPFNLIYHYSNKLNVLYGVTFSNNKIGARTKKVFLDDQNGKKVPVNLTQQAYETDSVYYNVGLGGTILPKLTGNFDVGYRTLSFSDNIIDFNAFGATSSLTWKTSPKLTTSIFLSRDFDSAGNGGTYRSTAANINAQYSISTDYKLSASLGRTQKFFRADAIRDIQNRNETLTNFSLNLQYYPSSNYSFSAGYTFTKSDSDDINRTAFYDNKEFRLSANLKY